MKVGTPLLLISFLLVGWVPLIATRTFFSQQTMIIIYLYVFHLKAVLQRLIVHDFAGPLLWAVVVWHVELEV